MGTVRDVYFDDSSWRIRCCVVDSGGWFAGRYVLVSRVRRAFRIRRRELWVRLRPQSAAASFLTMFTIAILGVISFSTTYA
jgi:hypothetical protein